MTQIAALLGSLVGWPVYAVVAAAIFLETAALVGMVVPSELVLVVAAVLAAKGQLSVVILVALAVVAAVAGDQVGYLLGRRAGPRMAEGRLGRWVGPARWDRARRFVAGRGVLTLVVGRWVGYVRTLVPLVSGMGAMPYRRFLISDVTASTVWVGGVVTLTFLGVSVT